MSPVYAHAPYERVAAAITHPDGRRLTVVARYTDGIIGADPVNIIVRDGNGAGLAKTESARDAIVQCPSYSACRVFLYEPPFAVLPKRILHLVDGGFVREESLWLSVLGTFLPIWRHPVELVLESAGVGFVPILGQVLARRRRTAIVIAARGAFAVVSFLWLSFVLLGIMLNTLVSIVWLALGVGTLVAIPAVFRAAVRGGPTTSCT